MDRPAGSEPDEIVLARAVQHDCRLGWSEMSTGRAVFKWRRLGQDLGAQFDTRRRALDWMTEWLDETPSGGIPRPVSHEDEDPSGGGVDLPLE
jgi:hypothetical protein